MSKLSRLFAAFGSRNKTCIKLNDLTGLKWKPGVEWVGAFNSQKADVFKTKLSSYEHAKAVAKALNKEIFGQEDGRFQVLEDTSPFTKGLCGYVFITTTDTNKVPLDDMDADEIHKRVEKAIKTADAKLAGGHNFKL